MTTTQSASKGNKIKRMFDVFSSFKKEDESFGPPHVVLNLSKIGLRYFRIGINASAASKQKLAINFSSHPNVGWIFYAEGYCNLAIGIWAKDNAEINDISQQIRSVLSPKDEIVFQSELTSLYSFGNRPSGGESQAMCVVDSTISPVALSPLEIDLIKLLTLDSSLNDVELSQLLNITEVYLHEVKHNLFASGVIVGYQDRIEYKGIYFKVFVDSLSRKKENAECDLVKSLWNDNACVYLERANSKYDLEFELVLKRKSDLKKYIKNFSDYKVSVLTKNVYTNLYPVNKVANLKEIKDAIVSQKGNVIDLRNSKLWYLNYSGAEAYLDIYAGNEKYFETMEKSELDLFEEIASFINKKYSDQSFSVVDIGSGDGIKGKFFIQKLGEEKVKAYYPVDIQPIEIAAALNVHDKERYAKHPTLLDIENISSRFPLKMHPKEKQIYIFLGGTYGNFPKEKINSYLKPLVNEPGLLLIAMPIVTGGKTDEEIIDSYIGPKFDQMISGSLLQVGFQRSDFKVNEKYEGTIAHFNMEDRRLVSSLVLKEKVSILDKSFEEGTTFKLTTSWKPTLDEFKQALSEDFVIEKIFHNKDMAIALVEFTR
jgi:uncharacterized SAM-dependent methyltransferase